MNPENKVRDIYEWASSQKRPKTGFMVWRDAMDGTWFIVLYIDGKLVQHIRAESNYRARLEIKKITDSMDEATYRKIRIAEVFNEANE